MAPLPSKQAESPQMVVVAFSVEALILKKVVSVSSFITRYYADSHLDCPQNTGPLPLSGRGSVGSGANAAPTSAKKWDTGRESGSWRDREGSGSFRPSERPPEKDSRPNHSLFNRNREASSDRRDEGERVGKNRYDDDRRNSRRRSRTRSRSRSPRQTGHEHRDGRGYVERSGDNRYRDKRRRLD